MPIIAPHLRPGTTEYEMDQQLGFARQHYPPHMLVCEWPDDCYVQWGNSGLVFSKEGNYRTAFFEAFPGDTFIRGEGETVEAAERSAFAKFERQSACPGHEWEARGYTNGLGFCKHCHKSSSNVFSWPCKYCSTPTAHHRNEAGEYLCKSCYETTAEGRRAHAALLELMGLESYDLASLARDGGEQEEQTNE